jgi:hypothetical protein
MHDDRFESHSDASRCFLSRVSVRYPRTIRELLGDDKDVSLIMILTHLLNRGNRVADPYRPLPILRERPRYAAG